MRNSVRHSLPDFFFFSDLLRPGGGGEEKYIVKSIWKIVSSKNPHDFRSYFLQTSLDNSGFWQILRLPRLFRTIFFGTSWNSRIPMFSRATVNKIISKNWCLEIICTRKNNLGRDRGQVFSVASYLLFLMFEATSRNHLFIYLSLYIYIILN